jgi:hypothetical protein
MISGFLVGVDSVVYSNGSFTLKTKILQKFTKKNNKKQQKQQPTTTSNNHNSRNNFI